MEYREQILKIRSEYLRGRINLAEARSMVEPLLDEMNRKGEAIAKKFGKKFHKLSFAYVFR